MKFPVNFPVSREFGSGDGFDVDCVRHHAVPQVSGYRDIASKARVSGADLTRDFLNAVSGSEDWPNSPRGLRPKKFWSRRLPSCKRKS